MRIEPKTSAALPLYRGALFTECREVVAIEHKTALKNPRHLQQNRHRSYFAVYDKIHTTFKIDEN